LFKPLAAVIISVSIGKFSVQLLMLLSHLKYMKDESQQFNLHMHYENVILPIVWQSKM